MMSLRCVAALLLVAALVLQANAAPQPFSIKKAFDSVKNKLSEKLSPALKCLSDAGAGDAALGYLQQCGQTKFYGKFALTSCAATAYAPADVKAMLKSSAKCFNMG
ncbi:uncharacterized protein LOC117643882 [Thrips palmi]|uniref:Uncharacterized protein LOC117643882 n=1 Tax=Thrips palmi TaxID=161013 RepID=A0A6P8ZLI4_THRPL|nr:uncharacterized protein LOC117643882 [Thrips palmi]